MPGPFLKARRTHSLDSATTAPAVALISEDEERLLLRRVAARDRQAFETLYRQYTPRLYRYLARLIHQPEIIEEVLDDVMVVVWQNATRFDGTAKPSTWVLGIAHHKALKARAKLSKQSADLPPPEPEGSQASDPAEIFKQQDLQCALAQALEHLTPEQRTVVELTFHQEYSYQEIAALMECPVNTVKTRMWHARQYLTRALGGFRSASTPATRPGRPPTRK
jgi:RNA polymerase sigma-70 factor (ECF subfamily)